MENYRIHLTTFLNGTDLRRIEMKNPSIFRTLFVLAVTVALAALMTLPVLGAGLGASDTGGRPFMVALSGAEEVPGPGDPDGSGTAFLTFNPGLGEVCWELTAANIDPAMAAHIHRAPAGTAGSIVVPLSPPVSGMSSGCAQVDQQLILEIIQHPEEFYVNVHSPVYPAGAIRGQLGR